MRRPPGLSVEVIVLVTAADAIPRVRVLPDGDREPGTPTMILTEQYANNRVECDHGRLKPDSARCADPNTTTPQQ